MIASPVLITGATGYIGGRLVPRLLSAGYAVRCLVRSPRKLASRLWINDPRVEVIKGDGASFEDVCGAMQGCGSAFYLIHSMLAAGADYRKRDRDLASTFARAARECGVERIIYLGGLGETGDGLSEHLTSRREVERELESTGVPVTVFRAAMIIGSGSASFEILRYLVERLPLMITPRWVNVRCQPIAVSNVLHYLIACLHVPETTGRTLDIGGPDTPTYAELMRTMAAARKLQQRWIMPVPVLTPRLSSYWIHLVTPIDYRMARPLAEGLRNEVVCQNDDAHRLMPQELFGIGRAINLALQNVRSNRVETAWSSAGPMPGDPDWSGGSVFNDERAIEIDAPPDVVFRALCRIGGGHGWYAAQWLWRFRGWMDRLVGGPGLRRGRRDVERVAYGDALDFWRVTDVQPNRHLALSAEMRLPGRAMLEFTLHETPTGTKLEQAARFIPRGLLGLAYWYAVLPLHAIVFRGMLGGIRRASVKAARAT